MLSEKVTSHKAITVNRRKNRAATAISTVQMRDALRMPGKIVGNLVCKVL